ncbi:MAG: response regulator transcription factor [Actinomycetota bacterium]
MIRILLVDDHPVVREGIGALLAREREFVLVGEADSGERAVREAELAEPDVVVLDLRLPGMDGIEVCERILQARPKTAVLILTSFPNDGAMLAAFAAGAKGFLIKRSELTTLREAIRVVAGGGTYVDPQVAGKLVALAARGRRATGPHGLSGQELRVVELLPRGLSNREIAEQLAISPHTVKSHMRSALRKLGARDRAEAAALVMREGLA